MRLWPRSNRLHCLIEPCMQSLPGQCLEKILTYFLSQQSGSPDQGSAVLVAVQIHKIKVTENTNVTHLGLGRHQSNRERKYIHSEIPAWHWLNENYERVVSYLVILMLWSPTFMGKTKLIMNVMFSVNLSL